MHISKVKLSFYPSYEVKCGLQNGVSTPYKIGAKIIFGLCKIGAKITFGLCKILQKNIAM